MTRLVVDASVAVKWLLKEDGWELAEGVLETDRELIAPDFLQLEVANAIWKRYLRGDLASAADEIMDHADALPIHFERTLDLIPAALSLALGYRRSVYDSLYVALAIREECQFVTADLRLHNAIRDAFPDTVVLLADLGR